MQVQYRFQAAAKTSRPAQPCNRSRQVFCAVSRAPEMPSTQQQQQEKAGASRRAMLAAGAALSLLPMLSTQPASAATKTIAPDMLSTFERADQRKEIVSRVTKYLSEVLTGADAPAVLRLVLHDAATYDINTKTGGFDGSIILDGELSRPENAEFKPLVAKLAEAKKKIDEESAAVGTAAISWADLLYVAGKVAVEDSWREIKLGKAATASGGTLIADVYKAEWPLVLGRQDASEPAPAGRLPAADAPVADIKAFLLALGAKPSSGPFAPKAPFWEKPGFVLWTAAAADPAAEEARFVAEDAATYTDMKKEFDQSRATITRTNYEVDFITAYNKLTSLGCKFDQDAYLHSVTIQQKRL